MVDERGGREIVEKFLSGSLCTKTGKSLTREIKNSFLLLFLTFFFIF